MKDFRTKEQRLKKMGYEAHFELADDDDFFGFDRKEQGWGMWRMALGVILALMILATAWIALGSMQSRCLELNGQDITKCV